MSGLCECGNSFDGDNLCVASACQWEGFCHCGDPVTYGYDGNPRHQRGMCAHCDPVRCDAYPGGCGR